MDEQRKLLDSLMGQTRDISLNEAKMMKGKNFMQENVCKFYMLGLCPQSELGESKMAGKRNIGECHKVHSDAMKAEFETHPDVDKFRSEYERQLLPVLEGLVREADAWVARERANVQKLDGPPETVTTSNMPPSVREQFETLKEDMNKMMAAAEVEAEKGNVDGSKFKVILAHEIKDKMKELEEKYTVTYTVTHRGEEVCEICGTRYEALTATNHARHAAHFQGKVHQSYVKIREWIKELRRKQRDSESQRDVRGRSQGESRKQSRDRERHRSRSPRRERHADSRDRERRRSRTRKDRHDRSSERGERGERSERTDRSDRGERGERSERGDRGERNDRGERGERGERTRDRGGRRRSRSGGERRSRNGW